MADLIEIIIVARDLATNTVDKATRRLESNLGSMRAEAAKTSTSFNSLSASTENFANRSERVAARSQQISRELQAAERALTGLGGATQDAADDLDRHITALRAEQAELRSTEQRAAGFTGALGRLGRALRETVTAHVSLGRAQSDNARGFSLFGTAVRDAERDTSRLSRTLGTLERAGRSAGRAIGDFGSGVFNADKKLKDFDTRSRAVGNTFGLMVRSLASVNAIVLLVLGGLALLPGALAGVSGAVVALTGGVTALVAALSSLSALAVVLPAAFAGLAGVIGAVVSILKPATSGILDFVKASDKAKQAAGTGGGGTGSTAQAVQDAERNLRTTRQVNALQEKRLESELAQARLDAVRRVRDAETNLAQTRESVFRRLIDLERQLVTLRADNDQQRAELEKSVAEAQQRARVEAAKPGGGRSVLAQALVGEAQADLDKFNRDAASAEGDLVSQIVQEREQGIAQIKKAELDLEQTRVDGVRHIRDLELSLKQTRIQNAQQELAAERALQQARAGPASASSAIDAAAAAFARLSPIQQKIAAQILAIKDRWKDLTAVFRDRFLRELSKDLDLVSGHLKTIADRTGLFADAITHTIARARNAFKDKVFTAALDVGVKDAARNTEQFGKVFINLGKALTIVTAAAKPFLDWITDSIVAWSRYVERVSKVNAANGDLATFFRHARETISTVVDIVKNLGVGLFNIGKIGRDSGQSLLDSIDGLTRRFRRFTESTSGKNAIKRFFDDAIPVVREIGGLIGNLVGRLAIFGRDAIRGGEKSPFVRTLNVVQTILNNVITAIGNIGKGLGPGALKSLADLSGLLVTISTHTGAIKVILGVVDGLIRLTKFLAGGDNPISNALASILTGVFLLSIAFPGLAKLIASKVVPAILTAIAEVVAGMFGWEAAEGGVAAGAFLIELALGTMLIPILLVIAAIAALVFILTHWDQTKRIVVEFIGFLVGLFGKAWDLIKRGLNAAWTAIKGFLKNHWLDIIAFFTGTLGFKLLIDHFDELWSLLKRGVSAAWDAITSIITAAWHGIVRFATNTLPGLLRRAFGAVWDGVESVTSKAIGGIISTVRGFVNTIIDAANWVLGKIPGVDLHIPKWNAPVEQANPQAAATRAASGWIGPEAVGTIVPATPGGLLHIVEAGHPEAVLSLDPKFRDRTLAIITEVLHRLGVHDPKRGLFEAIIRARAVARDLLPDEAITRFARGGIATVARTLGATPMAGGGIGGGGAALNTQLGKSIAALREAARIDRLNLAYLWGGGHQSSPAPSDGPFDCSGFVSHILQHVGLLGPTLVSGDLARYGSAGLSQGIGVLANAGHTYMEMLGKFYGTSSNNPGGGPGLLSYGVRSGFAQRKPFNWPFKLSDLSGNVSGGGFDVSGITDAITSGVGAVTSIGGHIFSSLGDAVRWISAHIPSFPHIDGLFGRIPGEAFGYVRDQIIDFAKSKVEFFQEGGIVQGMLGRAVPIVAHAGEWILNREQQLRLARLLGGWERARDLLFTTQQPAFATSFATGGIVSASTPQTFSDSSQKRVQIGPIYTASPDIDIDHIAAVADRRLAEMG